MELRGSLSLGFHCSWAHCEWNLPRWSHWCQGNCNEAGKSGKSSASCTSHPWTFELSNEPSAISWILLAHSHGDQAVCILPLERRPSISLTRILHCHNRPNPDLLSLPASFLCTEDKWSNSCGLCLYKSCLSGFNQNAFQIATWIGASQIAILCSHKLFFILYYSLGFFHSQHSL